MFHYGYNMMNNKKSCLSEVVLNKHCIKANLRTKSIDFHPLHRPVQKTLAIKLYRPLNKTLRTFFETTNLHTVLMAYTPQTDHILLLKIHNHYGLFPDIF